MNKRAKYLIELADQLDKHGFTQLAMRVDQLIKKISNYPDWSAKQRAQKEYALFQDYRSGKLTEQQYKDELKKMDEQARAEQDPFYEQRFYQQQQKSKQK